MSDFLGFTPKSYQRLLASFAGSQWVFLLSSGNTLPYGVIINIYIIELSDLHTMGKNNKNKNRQPNGTPEAQNKVSSPTNGTANKNGNDQAGKKGGNPSKTPDTKPKAKQKRTKRITLRFTPSEYQEILKVAAKCGRKKSDYAQSCVTGHHPCYLMTDKQANALMTLGVARADLQNIANVLHGQPQEVRKKYFKNTYFMEAWISGINALIERWRDIEQYFSNSTITQHHDSEG